MYIGTYYHKLESKNRVSLPVKFRSLLGSQGIITKGLDGCLFIFDMEEWTKLVDSGKDLSFTKKSNRDYVRLLANNAQEIEFDSQGRILIPQDLKEKIDLKKDVVIVGSLMRIEIWDKQDYMTYATQLDDQAEEITEKIEFPEHKSSV